MCSFDSTSETVRLVSGWRSWSIFLVEEHEFSAAHALIENTKCSYFFLAAEHYASDAVAAEQALQRSSDTMDICFGPTEFAKAASANGNIPDALLRFIDAAQRGCGRSLDRSGLRMHHLGAQAHPGNWGSALRRAETESTGLEKCTKPGSGAR